MFGMQVDIKEFNGGTDRILDFDMTGYQSGLFIIRIVSDNEVKTFNIIKN
jgi:hypothetical protein